MARPVRSTRGIVLNIVVLFLFAVSLVWLSTPAAAQQVALTVSATTVAPGGVVTVSWSGVGNPSDTDWIGLYTSGVGDKSYLNWFYTSSLTKSRGGTSRASGSHSYTMPTGAGTYEFRLFAQNVFTRLATSVTVTVSATTVTPPPPPTTPPPPPPTEPVTGRSFSDLPSNHWAYTTIMEMVELGILSGYPDGTFRPNNTVSRAEFASIMVRALNLGSKAPSTPTFTDVPANHWAYGVVESSRDFLTGYRDARTGRLTFEPNSVAVREDVAVAIVKAEGLGNTHANLGLLNQFQDQGQISAGLRNKVAIAVERGFMRGTNIGFEPQKALTRAEACALLSRIIKRGGKEKIVM